MREVIKTSEAKIKSTCDQLIAWGFCCNKPAAFLVERLNSTEYAIICADHKPGFERIFPSEGGFIYHEYSHELNVQIAERAEKANAAFMKGE